MIARPTSALVSSLGGLLCLCATALGGRIEVGQLDLPAVSSPSTFERIDFQQSFERTPLVFAVTPDTADGRGIVRLNNVDTTGFDLAYLEAPAEDADHGSVQGVSFLAIEPGRHQLAPGVVIEAGSIETSDTVVGGGSEPTRIVEYKGSFSGTPVVVTATQTFRNEPAAQPGTISSPFLATSVAGVSASDFKVALERAETLDGSTVTQPETIAYLVFPEAFGSTTNDAGDPVLFDALGSGTNVDDNPTFVAFNQAFGGAPLVLAQQVTRNGGDGGWVRLQSATAGGASVFIQEDVFGDSDTNHTNEEVALLAFAEAFEAELNFVTTTITWQGVDAFSTNTANWDNWDGSDANLIVGDELIFNDTGATTTSVDVEVDYAAPLGRIEFQQNTAYTLGGSGGFQVDDGGRIVNNTPLTQRIDVDLAGTGSDLILDAQNPVGTLDLNGNLDLADTGGVVLRVLGDGDVSIDGNVIGDGGSLWKQGAGSLTLSGTNTFDGSLQIDAGDVTLVGGDAVADDVDVLLTSASAGLNLAADETFATLAGIGTVNLATHRLTLDADADTTFSGTISGASPAAGLTHRGSGTLTLTDDHTFPGELRIEEGTVIAQGNLTGDVLNQARFRGSGTVTGDLTATAGSNTEVGDGVGTMRVSGNAQFDADATLRIDLNSNGMSDTLDVAGALTFAADSRIDPSLAGDWRSITDGQRFVIAEADAGVTDSGLTVLSTDSLLRFVLDPAFFNGDAELALVASTTVFEPRATGGNRAAVARGLDSLIVPGISGETEAELTTLNDLSDASLNAALDQLSPTAYAAAPAAVRAHHAALTGRIGRHLDRQRRGLATLAAPADSASFESAASRSAFGFATLASAGDDPAALSAAMARLTGDAKQDDAGHNDAVRSEAKPAAGFRDATSATASRDAAPRLGGFVEGFTLRSDHGDHATMQARLRGGHLGFDRRVGERWTLGFAFAAGTGEVDSHPDGGSSDWITFAGGPYAAYRGDSWFFDAGFTLGHDRFESQRDVDALDAEPTSDWHTWNASVNARVGTDLDLGPWTFTPQLGLAYQHTRLDGTRENNAGSLGLHVPGQNSDSLRTRVGLGARSVFSVGNAKVAPELFVGYERDWLSGETTEARFLAGGDAFDIATAFDARDSLLLGGGVSVLLNPRSSLFARYDGRFDADGETHAVTAGWAWRF